MRERKGACQAAKRGKHPGACCWHWHPPPALKMPLFPTPASEIPHCHLTSGVPTIGWGENVPSGGAPMKPMGAASTAKLSSPPPPSPPPHALHLGGNWAKDTTGPSLLARSIGGRYVKLSSVCMSGVNALGSGARSATALHHLQPWNGTSAMSKRPKYISLFAGPDQKCDTALLTFYECGHHGQA